MGCINQIGRVGALAVTVALGVAIANSPVALADPSVSPSTGPSSDLTSVSTAPSPSPSTPGTGTASSPGPASTNPSTQLGPSTVPQSGTVQASGGANTTVNGTVVTVSTTPTTATSGTSTTTQPSQSADPSTTVSASEPATMSQSDPTIAPSATDSLTSANGSSPNDVTATNVVVPVVNTELSSSQRQLAAAAVSPASALPTVTVVATPTGSAIASLPELQSQPQSFVAQPQSFVAQPAAVVVQPTPPAVSAPPNIITGLISGLLSVIGFNPQAANGPGAPAQAPTLWALLAWVRREIGQVFFNINPGAAMVTQSLVVSPNLLVNPGAELGDPSLSGLSSVTVPGWMATGTPTVIPYGTLRQFPLGLASPLPPFPAFLGFPVSDAGSPGGNQFFAGGPVASSSLTQTVDLSAAASEIDGGTVPYKLSADLGGYILDPSATLVTVNFLDANQASLGTGQLQPVTLFDRLFVFTGLQPRQSSGTIPVGTRSAQVVLNFMDGDPFPGNLNNAYADNLSFTVGADLPAPPPPARPASSVTQLDHVFLVYLENHGVTDVIGSPNAPYFNSLVATYGYDSNYYALTHPSSPNYYPILGGSDFGLTYNCPSNCFDQRNLVDNLEAARKTWAGYEQNGGGFTDPGQLPFLAFNDIFTNPARVANIVPLTQLSTDLKSAATTPNFVWFSADENNAGEGPIDVPFGLLAFVLSQLTDHQYNVKAADNFLRDNVSTILNSKVWNDPTQKSAIFITFDEDYNNLSLGIGNQGNHVPLVVIPSQGAVNSGVRGGNFVTDDYGNHYSLLRTIEDSLGLPPLTNNDKFAPPLNGFFTPNPAAGSANVLV